MPSCISRMFLSARLPCILVQPPAVDRLLFMDTGFLAQAGRFENSRVLTRLLSTPYLASWSFPYICPSYLHSKCTQIPVPFFSSPWTMSWSLFDVYALILSSSMHVPIFIYKKLYKTNRTHTNDVKGLLFLSTFNP